MDSSHRNEGVEILGEIGAICAIRRAYERFRAIASESEFRHLRSLLLGGAKYRGGYRVRAIVGFDALWLRNPPFLLRK